MEVKEIERALIRKYRSKLYCPFIKAILEYELVKPNDVIAVCISGGKDSFVLAKLFQELQKHSNIPFSVKYIVMNPGFNQENLDTLISNSKKLDIPILIKNSNVFEVAQRMDKDRPCYLCARMRRGFLYKFAQEQGCNKIALGHHFNDVIETILLNILYNGTYKTMIPKLKAQNFPNMELIRPLVYVEEKNIINYMKYIDIQAMNCGCKVASNELPSKRKYVKKLISELRKDFKNVDMNIYRSAENINLNRSLGWIHKDLKHSFLEEYDDVKQYDENE
jgi:tRNA(Ile)-lysidine synthase TilS/MesJ